MQVKAQDHECCFSVKHLIRYSNYYTKCAMDSISTLSYVLNHWKGQIHLSAACVTAAICIFHRFNFLYE